MTTFSKDARTPGVESQFIRPGVSNPKYVDVLDEDKAIAGQKFVCISFLSPEKILEKKELYFFNAFLKQWEMAKGFEKYTQFLSFIAYKYDLSFDGLNSDLAEFCETEKDNLFATNMEDDYKNYLDVNEERLEKEFGEVNSFQTNVRGVKIRGTYPTQEEAELRCKMIREVDPDHDVYVGPVGLWMPFHPEAYRTGRVEYLEEELNQLMHEKVKNETEAKQQFEKRLKETRAKAIADNERKAIESGNVLTQTIDDKGELVSVKDTNTTEKNLDSDVAVADIHKELFNGENVVTDKNTDHGLSAILNKGNANQTDADQTDANQTDANQTDANQTDANPMNAH